MQVVPDAIFPPNVCCCCSTHLGPLVDTLREDQYGNRLYFCWRCVTGMAETIGMFGAEEATRLQCAIAAVSAENDHLAAIREEFEQLSRSVRMTLTHGPSYGRDGKPRVRRAAPKPKAKVSA